MYIVLLISVFGFVLKICCKNNSQNACRFKKSPYLCNRNHIAGWSREVARWAHNPKVVGSNPAPATKQEKSKMASLFCFIHINLLRELLNSLKKQLRNLSAFAGRFRSCYLVCRVKVLRTLLAKVGWMRRLAFSSRHEARGIVLLLARRANMSV